MVNVVFLLDETAELVKGEIVEVIEKYHTYIEGEGEIGYSVIKVAAETFEDIVYEDWNGRQYTPSELETIDGEEETHYVMCWSEVA